MSNNYRDKVEKYRGKYFNLVKQLDGKTLNHLLLESDINEIVPNIPFDVILIGSGALSFYLKDLYCVTKDEDFLEELDKLKVNDLDFIHGSATSETGLNKVLGKFSTNNQFGKNIVYKRDVPLPSRIESFDLSFVPDLNDFVTIDGIKVINLDILSELYKKSATCKTPNSEKIRILDVILKKVKNDGELKNRYVID